MRWVFTAMTDPKRRNVLKLIGGAGALVAGGVGTVGASGGPPSDGDTIVDVAAEADDFDVLVAAVQEAGLVETLSANRQLTVFAPTDEAFEAVADDLGVEVEDLLELENLEEILTYHVTPGRRRSPSVVNAPKIEMLNGDTVAVDGTTLNDGQAEIIDTDIEASNGVIHVIDGVLLP